MIWLFSGGYKRGIDIYKCGASVMYTRACAYVAMNSILSFSLQKPWVKVISYDADSMLNAKSDY